MLPKLSCHVAACFLIFLMTAQVFTTYKEPKKEEYKPDVLGDLENNDDWLDEDINDVVCSQREISLVNLFRSRESKTVKV
jgi:hypothetical protein